MRKKKFTPPFRYSKGQRYQMPHAVLKSENYRKMSHRGRSLLHDLLLQFNGRNNGNLCAAEGIMRHYGWTSKTELMKARYELEHYRFIEKTQQGNKTKKPDLYAVTFYNIQYAPDSGLATRSDYPMEAYRTEQSLWIDPYRKTGKRKEDSMKFFASKTDRQVSLENQYGSPLKPVKWIIGGKWRVTGSPSRPIPPIFVSSQVSH